MRTLLACAVLLTFAVPSRAESDACVEAKVPTYHLPASLCKGDAAAAKFGDTAACSQGGWNYIVATQSKSKLIEASLPACIAVDEEVKGSCAGHENDSYGPCAAAKDAAKEKCKKVFQAKSARDLTSHMWDLAGTSGGPDKRAEIVKDAGKSYASNREAIIHYAGGYEVIRDYCVKARDAKEPAERQDAFERMKKSIDLFNPQYPKLYDDEKKKPKGAALMLSIYSAPIGQLPPIYKQAVDEWQTHFKSQAEIAAEHAGHDEVSGPQLAAGEAQKKRLEAMKAGGEAGSTAANEYLATTFDQAGYKGVNVTGSTFTPDKKQVTSSLEVDWAQVGQGAKDPQKVREELAKKLGVPVPAPDFKGKQSVKVTTDAESLDQGVQAFEQTVKSGGGTFKLAVQNTMEGMKHPEEKPSETARKGMKGVAGEIEDGHSEKEIKEKTQARKAELAKEYAEASASATAECQKKKEEFMSSKGITFDMMVAGQVPQKTIDEAKKVAEDCKAKSEAVEKENKRKLEEVTGRDKALDDAKKTQESSNIKSYEQLLQVKRDETTGAAFGAPAPLMAKFLAADKTLGKTKGTANYDAAKKLYDADKLAFDGQKKVVLELLDKEAAELKNDKSTLRKTLKDADDGGQSEFNKRVGPASKKLRDLQKGHPGKMAPESQDDGGYND